MKLAHLLMLSLSLGCAHRPAASYQPLSASAPAEAPRLLFLSCRLTTGTAGSRLDVLNVKAVAGELKTPVADVDTPHFVRVSQLDRHGQPLAQTRVPHPLRRHVEHVGEDHRTFQRSEVVLPTAEFFVRLALQPAAAIIRIEEVADGNMSLLTELPIPPKS